MLLPPLINNRIAGLKQAFTHILHETIKTTLRTKMLEFENDQQDADGIFTNIVCIPTFPNQQVQVTCNLLCRWLVGLALDIQMFGALPSKKRLTVICCTLKGLKALCLLSSWLAIFQVIRARGSALTISN